MAKTMISPNVCACYEENANRYDIQVELPGVKKTDIDLEMLSGGFMVKATRENVEYMGDDTFCCPVDTTKVEANFDNGLLTIRAPLRDGNMKATKIGIK